MRFLARPAKGDRAEELLNEHLASVAQRAKRNVVSSAILDREELAELAWLCGLTHDFGKYTTYFQEKLPPLEKNPPKKAYSHHAFVSALLGACVARSRYPDDPEAALLVYLAIHRHHGHLITPSEILPREKHLRDAPRFNSNSLPSGLRRELVGVEAQLQNIRGAHQRQIVSEMKELGVPEIEEFLEQSAWWSILPEIRSSYRSFLAEDDPVATRRYWRMLLLFCALIDADKHISAGADALEDMPRAQIASALVEKHVRKVKEKATPPSSPTAQRLAEIRDEIHEESARNIESTPLEELYPAVLSLTAPTGAGKTLTALDTALRLRERVNDDLGHLPRIIYTLPFVNIIEQNASVIEEVLSQKPDFKRNPSRYLLKSHHLAPPGFQEDEDVSIERKLLFADGWESEIVVSTFVSGFESLVTNRNRALKKLHNIAGSIVVLDEIQSVPYEQWELIRHVLTTLTEHLGCTVIQMTATRPRILRTANEILTAPERNFSGLSRTRIVPHPKVTTLEELAQFIEEIHTPERSLLVVLNTIKSSVELYGMLKERLGLSPYREYGRDPGEASIFYLSTNITPWQRSRRVRLLGQCMRRGGKPLVISTQVVEAGVDLDFDEVVRDQGPLDSIVQVAGRCNRGGGSPEPGLIHMVFLEDDNGRGMAEMVYGRVLPPISRRVLRTQIEEPDLYGIVEQYFADVEDRKCDDYSLGFIRAIKDLEFHRWEGDNITISRYRHIQEEGETRPVLVEINEEAVRAIERLERLYQEGKAVRRAFQEAFRATAPFTITPTSRRIEKNPPPNHSNIPEHFHITRAEVQSEHPAFYNPETGFKWESEAVLL
jgi:CRISPR-associated endonuclease/helicase Cas3